MLMLVGVLSWGPAMAGVGMTLVLVRVCLAMP